MKNYDLVIIHNRLNLDCLVAYDLYLVLDNFIFDMSSNVTWRLSLLTKPEVVKINRKCSVVWSLPDSCPFAVYSDIHDC